MNLKSTYNRIAGDYLAEHQNYNWWQAGADKFIALLPKGALVLDLGCGPGIDAAYLTSKGLRIVGIDISEKMITLAKERVPSGKFFVMDMIEVPSLPHEFDGIYAKASLLHVPKKDLPGVLEKLRSKLKAGGYLYITVKEIRPGQSGEEVKQENRWGYPFKRFFSYFTLPELKRFLSDGNFQICWENINDGWETHWLQVIARK